MRPIHRVLLVVNPAARRAGRAERRARAAFARAGVACAVCRTERPGHAAELVAALGSTAGAPFGSMTADRNDPFGVADGPDAVFTLGGDGTAMEVVGALAGTGVPVGVLPGGTGNLVARTLGTPLDPGRAVAALLAGTAVRVDLGVVRALGAGAGERHFAFSAGVGVDAHMIARTPAAWKRRLGVLAYVLTAARAVIAGERFEVRATVDGREWHGEASAVMVVNFGAVLGDLFHFGPGIAADDGRLDLCIFTPRTLADAVRVLWRLARRDFREDPALHYRPGTEFRVETVPPLPAQADGELLGPTPLVIRTVPLAATLLVPARAPSGPDHI